MLATLTPLQRELNDQHRSVWPRMVKSEVTTTPECNIFCQREAQTMAIFPTGLGVREALEKPLGIDADNARARISDLDTGSAFRSGD